MQLKISTVCLIALLQPSLVLPVRAASLVPTRSVTVTYDMGDQRLPTWSYGALVVVANNGSAHPIVHVLAADGRELTPTAFAVPGANRMLIEGAVHAKDGRVAVCGVAYADDGRGGGFVAWFLPGSQDATVVRTAPYSPYLITAAPDGTIWTEGIEMVNGVENRPTVNKNNGVLRGFDPSGKMTQQLAPRNSRAEDAVELIKGVLTSSQDRVGWYLEKANKYVEAQFDGTVKQYPGAPALQDGFVTAVTLLKDGRVVVSGTTRHPREAHFYTLDRETGTWRPIDVPGRAVPPILYGAEGEQIVTVGSSRFELAFFEVH